MLRWVLTFFIASFILFVAAWFFSVRHGKSIEKIDEKKAEYYRNACIQMAAMLFSLSSGLLVFDQNLQQQAVVQKSARIDQFKIAQTRRLHALGHAFSTWNHRDFFLAGLRHDPACDVNRGDEKRSAEVCQSDFTEGLVGGHPPLDDRELQRFEDELEYSADLSNFPDLVPGDIITIFLRDEDGIVKIVDSLSLDIEKWPDGASNVMLLNKINNVLLRIRFLRFAISIYSLKMCICENYVENSKIEIRNVMEKMAHVTLDLNGNLNFADLHYQEEGVVRAAMKVEGLLELYENCDETRKMWGLI